MFGRSAIFLALTLAATTACPQSATSAAATPPTAPAYAKPALVGKLVDIGGRRLDILCKGKPVGPVVMFENGLTQYVAHSTFGKVQSLIAPFAQVCIYDRAGLGWSDPVAGARTQADMVEDLHKLVVAEHFQRPLVLVGFSLGGLLVRRYAEKYPADVAGMVLIDASPSSVIFAPDSAPVRQAIIAKIDGALKGARDGVPVAPMPAGTPAEVQMAFTPLILRTVKQEYRAIDRVPAAFRKSSGYGTLGNKPLAVIRRGKTSIPPSKRDIAWRKAQEAMLSLSTRSFMVVAKQSSHVIPYEQPQVVADAVQRVLHEIGRRQR